MTLSKFIRTSTTLRNAPSKGTNMNEATNVILKDVTFFWPKLDKPVEPFGTLQYELQVQVPKKREKEISAYGKVKAQEGGMVSINLRKKAEKADGTPAAKVRVVDASKEPLDPKLIGNGSKGNVILMLKDYQIKGPRGNVTKEGTSVMLTAVQVTELVEYERKNSGDFVDFDDETTESSTRSFDGADEPKKASPKKTAKEASFDDMEDDIPF